MPSNLIILFARRRCDDRYVLAFFILRLCDNRRFVEQNIAVVVNDLCVKCRFIVDTAIGNARESGGQFEV